MTDDEFTRLFEDHYAAVLAYGLRRVDPETARDVAAETFLVAWRQLRASPDIPGPWLLAVARRVLANELRRRGRSDRLNERVAQAVSIEARMVVQNDHADAITSASPVTAAMASLSDRDQELLQLIGWEQLDQRAAAHVLGCSVAAVRVRLHRARRRLEAALRANDEAEREPPAAPAVPLHRPGPTIDLENRR